MQIVAGLKTIVNNVYQIREMFTVCLDFSAVSSL